MPEDDDPAMLLLVPKHLSQELVDRFLYALNRQGHGLWGEYADESQAVYSVAVSTDRLPPTDVDGPTCPACGSQPGEVSMQTAPGQHVCTAECPVNSWTEEQADA